MGAPRGPGGAWRHISDATVYFDHPVHLKSEHTLNIDLYDSPFGTHGRVGIEMAADLARKLVDAIEQALTSAGHLG